VNHDARESFRDLVTDGRVRVVDAPNKGYGAGLNRGVREMKGRDGVVLVCNPDITILRPDAMSDAVNYLLDHPDVACLMPVIFDPAGEQQSSCRKFYTWHTMVMSRMFSRHRVHSLLPGHFYLDRDLDALSEVDWGMGAAMLVRTPLFPEKIAFDERFFLYFEDVDLCAQAWATGYKVIRYPSFRICHIESGRSRHKPLFFGLHLVSALRFVLKYKGLPLRSQLQANTNFIGSTACVS
jgi:GT2 family glycosyltransferase